MTTRTNIASGSPWEDRVGYSRAVRVGDLVFVSGTTASDGDGRTLAAGDAYEQTRHALKKIEHALKEAGASLRDVVRTRMYVTDMKHQDGIGRAHQEFFGEIRPAATMVQVAGLINDDMLVEIEADAVITEQYSA